MFFYSYFSGHGREILVAALGAEDPFGLAPAEIVERVLAAGYPVVDQPKEEPWRYVETVSQVDRDEHTFLVAVSRDAQEIGLQEMAGRRLRLGQVNVHGAELWSSTCILPAMGARPSPTSSMPMILLL